MTEYKWRRDATVTLYRDKEDQTNMYGYSPDKRVRYAIKRSKYTNEGGSGYYLEVSSLNPNWTADAPEKDKGLGF